MIEEVEKYPGELRDLREDLSLAAAALSIIRGFSHQHHSEYIAERVLDQFKTRKNNETDFTNYVDADGACGKRPGVEF